MKALFLAPFLVHALHAAAATADFYFVDVAQGNATLIVAPSGQTLLLDAGVPRAAGAVFEVIQKAGIHKIDYLIGTHYHADHIGGVEPLAAKIPIAHFVDHGPSLEFHQSEDWWRKLKGNVYKEGMGTQYDEMFAGYQAAVAKGRHIVVKPGDRIPVKGMDALVVASAGRRIAKSLPGAGAPNAACVSFQPRLDDYEEDGQSVGLLITFGKFRFVYLGDLTWNLSQKLFCPDNPVGKVDAYVITHHARSYPKEAGENSWSLSSVPELEPYALQPRVAFLSLGSGGHPRGDALQAVKSAPGIEDIWQAELIRAGAEKDSNSPEQFIATIKPGSGQAAFIKLSANRDGSFDMTNSRNGYTKHYPPRH